MAFIGSYHRRPVAAVPIFSGLAIIALLLVSCGTGRTSTAAGQEGLIWEAWELVNGSYASTAPVDSETVSNGIIAGMLEAAGEPPYPFLTDLQSVRRRLPRSVPRELGNVWKAWTLLRSQQPELEPRALATAGVEGLVAGLGDRSTQYLTPEAYDRAQEEQVTSYEGIGAFVSEGEDGSIVLSPMRGGPAERAGVRRGDVLVAVDGQSVVGLTAEEIVGKVRGASRSRVTLEVQRRNQDGTLEFAVTRSTVDVPSVEVQLLPGAIGYIFVSDFKESTPLEILDVLERLKQVEMLALILDLRLNPDGPVDTARKVASQFLPSGLFMYEVDRHGNRTDWFIEEGGIATKELPMAVLVNEDTSSVAEALASALHDLGRVTVVGTQTRGTGTANSYIELSDGSAIHLPVSRWYTPVDRAISGSGVTPDISVALTSTDRAIGRDTQLGEAYGYLDGLLPPFR